MALTGTDKLRRGLSAAAAVLTPTDPGYDRTRMLLNRRFNYRPGVIVQCATNQDVARTIQFAREKVVRISVRAGGTSPGGFSSNNGGVLLDLSKFSGITVAPDGQTVRVGAGALLRDVYNQLGPTGSMIPAGVCMPVGMAGITLGGGLGCLSRSLGLTLDNLLQATVVTATGDILAATAVENSDLFWALRGAGGGNFGVVTELTLRLHNLPSSITFARIAWPEDQAASVLHSALSYFANEAPDAVSGLMSFFPLPGGSRAMGALVVYNGPSESAQKELARLTGLGKPLSSKVDAMPYFKLVTAIPDQVRGIHDYYKSAFVSGVMPMAAMELLVDGFRRAVESAPTIENMIMFELTGGAINRVRPTDTAFVHRDHSSLLSVVATWVGADGTPDPPERRWADGLYAALRPYVTREVYQNYPDLELSDWGRAYYGENLERLKVIKGCYDPENVFRFPQGISPA